MLPLFLSLSLSLLLSLFLPHPTPRTSVQAIAEMQAWPPLAERCCHFVPREGDLSGFFRPLARALHARLQTVPCVPTSLGAWVPPPQALLAAAGPDAALPPELIRDALGLHYVDRAHATGCAAALRALGVQPLGPGHVLDVLQALVAGGDLATRGPAWLGQCLALLARLLGAAKDDAEAACATVARLAGLPLVPVAGGTERVAPAAARVYHAARGAALSAAAQRAHAALGVRVLDPAVVDGADEGERDAVLLLLERAGVRRLEPAEVLSGHVVPWLETEGPQVCPGRCVRGGATKCHRLTTAVGAWYPQPAGGFGSVDSGRRPWQCH